VRGFGRNQTIDGEPWTGMTDLAIRIDKDLVAIPEFAIGEETSL
jgi:hypothetical protein